MAIASTLSPSCCRRCWFCCGVVGTDGRGAGGGVGNNGRRADEKAGEAGLERLPPPPRGASHNCADKNMAAPDDTFGFGPERGVPTPPPKPPIPLLRALLPSVPFNGDWNRNCCDWWCADPTEADREERGVPCGVGPKPYENSFWPSTTFPSARRVSRRAKGRGFNNNDEGEEDDTGTVDWGT